MRRTWISFTCLLVTFCGGPGSAAAQEGCDGLGERVFTVERPGSVFSAAAVAGADVSIGAWSVEPLRICAEAEVGDGVHPLRLLNDALFALFNIDTSVTCIKIFAEGSAGSLDCDGGSAHDVVSTQDSNGTGPADPPVVETGLGIDAGPGAATLTVQLAIAALPAGSELGDCAVATLSEPFPGALTTAGATAIVTEGSGVFVPPDGVVTLSGSGSNFYCAFWQQTDGAGALVLPLNALDTIIGDTGAMLRLVDEPEDEPYGGDDRIFVTDELGRALVLHGVNVTDDRRTQPEQFSTDASDYERIASWGFNVIRLNLFWQSLEPTQGTYDTAYLERIVQILDWARDAGLLVILDFHQDQYGPPFGRGMPEWSARDDGLPFDDVGSFNNYFQPAVMACFDHFYADADLRQAYEDAWLTVVAAAKDHPALLAYDLINEPFTGTATVEDFEETILPAFYERLFQAIRTLDQEHWILYEPFAFTTVPGQPTKLPVLDGERLIYAPHMYHPVTEFGNPYVPDNYLERYANIRIPEGSRQGAPILVGEWGAKTQTENRDQYLRDALASLDTFGTGWTIWVYHRDGTWGLLDDDGNERSTVDFLVRTYPQRIAGEPTAFSYDPDTRVATVSFEQKTGVSGPTEIFVPSARVYPEGWTVSVSDPDGTSSSSWDPDRQILSVVTDPNQSEHTITVQPTERNHYKCYKTRQLGARFARRDVTLEDQFAATNTTVVKPRRFCNPVDKNGEGIGDPTAHLMCYKIKEPRFERRNVVVENQFGEQTLTVTRPDTLCVPAEKDAVPSALNIDHFKCYKVRKAKGTPKFTPPTDVDLEDQFETKATTVVRPKYLCTPVDKNGEGLPDPEGHLMCYKIKDAPGQPSFQRQQVDIVDQFAEQDLNTVRGDCRRSSFLCVPSSKRLASPNSAFLEVASGVLD